MDLRTIFEFQIGRATAIRAVAQSRAALWVGVVLVLATAIARNYDQSFFFETPMALFGPLLFSLGSAAFIFIVIRSLFLRRPAPAGEPPASAASQFRTFLGLFWMTAPIGWLYAIPVERLFDSYRAAQANLSLLAIVAAWRVLLLARVLSVLHGMRFMRTLGWVLLPACAEVMAIAMFGGMISRSILAGMGGMRNSPEEELLYVALGNAFIGAFVLGIVTAVALAAKRSTTRPVPLPALTQDAFPGLDMAAILAIWSVIAIQPQRELQRNLAVTRMLAEKRYAETLAFEGV